MQFGLKMVFPRALTGEFQLWACIWKAVVITPAVSTIP